MVGKVSGGVFLDHLVLAVPDLAAGVAGFAALTGVSPARGGSHVGLGTANALVALGGGAYLEIVGPDLEQPAPEWPRPLLVDEVSGPRLVTWAVRPAAAAGLDDTVAAARAVGYDPGEPAAMSRRTADGQVLSWRLTPFTFTAAGGATGGVVPFLIGWGNTPHPTTRDLPAVELVTLTGTHPDPSSVQPALGALGVGPDLLTVSPGPPALTAVLRTPRGERAV